ncbi:MAG: outer-membrane lipoprotein carrier protein LolA [Muribaculaceae bacterium]|nr:outer-membrane lipoprotein carrier protein LolA [Muribaculaceae bacterium]
MKRTCLFTLLFLLTAILSGAQNLSEPLQILDKAIAKITSSKGCRANFKVFNSGYSGSGSILSSGNKFKVTMPDAEVWYNGKDLYTYNKRAGETTVVVPSPEELAESNPLAYVTSARNKYNVTFSTVKKTDRYVLELTPKVKNGDIKRITLTLKKADFSPEKIVVEPKSGSPVSAEITSFKINVTTASSEFEYPKSKFSEIELIDLR